MDRILKNRFLLKVSSLEKVPDKEGLKVVDVKWIKMAAKDFENSLNCESNKGINHKIEIVNSPPEKFQVNTIYIRRDGKQAYVYVVKDS